MKRIKITTIFASLLSLLAVSSCQDALTEINPNRVTVGNFWLDLDDVQAGLNSTYATLRKEEILNIRYESVRSDLAWPSNERPSNNTEAQNWYEHQYINSSIPIEKKWNALYTGVWRANQVIEALERLSYADSERGVQQMAEARFLRGVFYFYLHSAFNNGSVVLKQKTPENPDEFHQPLSSSEDVKAFFRKDLQYAINHLATTRTESNIEIPIKATAQTIMGTSYLYDHDYKMAGDLFWSVISEGPFELADHTKMFTGNGEFNSESIFEIPYSMDLHTELGDWHANAMTNPLNIFSKSWFVPSSWLSELYIMEKNDRDMTKTVNSEKNEGGVARTHSLRASAMVALIDDYFTPYYIKDNATVQKNFLGGPNSTWSFARWKKYQNHDTVEVEVPSRSGKNIVVNRLSDVYLMYAECMLKQSSPNIATALEYINKVRSRWALKTIGGDDYDTVDEIMNHLMFVERPLELSAEGHQIRWQDLRRWGLLEEDENNIFLKWSKKTFYGYTPIGQAYALDGTKKTLTLNYSTVSSTWPKNAVGADIATTAVVVIDYEYDQPYRNYSKRLNLFYPIPASEISNNTNL